MNKTSNPSAVIETATYTVVRTIAISATIEKVWSAVTEPAHISRWFGRAEFDGAGVGARGSLNWPDHGPIPLRIEAVDAPRMVAYRWSNDDAGGASPAEVDDEHSTVFTFTLESLPNGTQLTVVETGFEHTTDPIANLESHRDGWNSELDKLVALLESSS